MSSLVYEKKEVRDFLRKLAEASRKALELEQKADEIFQILLERFEGDESLKPLLQHLKKTRESIKQQLSITDFYKVEHSLTEYTKSLEDYINKPVSYTHLTLPTTERV